MKTNRKIYFSKQLLEVDSVTFLDKTRMCKRCRRESDFLKRNKSGKFCPGCLLFVKNGDKNAGK